MLQVYSHLARAFPSVFLCSPTRLSDFLARKQKEQDNTFFSFFFPGDGNALFLQCCAGKIMCIFSSANFPFFTSPFAALRYS